LATFQAPATHPYWRLPDTVNLDLKTIYNGGKLSCWLLLHWRIWKVIHSCKTCENLVRVATTIDKLQHLEYLKSPFFDTCEWAIRPVFPEHNHIWALTDSPMAQNHSCLGRVLWTIPPWKMTRKYNISLKVLPLLVHTKIQHSGGCLEANTVQGKAECLDTPPYAVFSVHMCGIALTITYYMITITRWSWRYKSITNVLCYYVQLLML